MAIKATRREHFNGKGVSHYYCVETLLQVLLGTVSYFIGYYLFSLYYCPSTCFVSIEIGKAKSAILSVLKLIRSALNYSVIVVSACTHPCNTNTFTHSLTKYTYFNWKSIIYEWSCLKLKSFPFRHNRHFNPKFV